MNADTPTRPRRVVGGPDASSNAGTTGMLPVTPNSQLETRSRKRRRAPSLSDSQQPDRSNKVRVLEPLPSSALLLALPKLFITPPNHRAHVTSYILALNALRECSKLDTLSPDVECRVWMSLAEVGLKIVRAGWSQDEENVWARGLENEVETAIGRGILIAQSSPSLLVYKQALTLLQARLEHWQRNSKRSRMTLKRLSSSFVLPSDKHTFEIASTPSWLVYTTHLTVISHALSTSPPDFQAAFGTLQELLSVTEKLKDPPVRLLAHVLQLRIFVDAGLWDKVGASLMVTESVLGLTFSNDDTVSTPTADRKESVKLEEFISFDDPFEAAMAIHVLIIGVLFYTYSGHSKRASSRLSHLHSLLDSDSLSKFPKGVVDIKLSSGPPLTMRCTHPRVLFHMVYLVSSISKKDAAGRKPKRKVFAAEGLKVWEKEFGKEIDLHPWVDPCEAEEVNERMVKMKADLISEMVAVCILRSEFEDANDHLASLIAHTRSYDLFEAYSARITLHHAHLAHALGHTSRAEECYAVAAHLAEEGTFVNVSARIGSLVLRIARGECSSSDVEWDAEVQRVVASCKGMGGTLEAIGYVLQACTASEVLAAKQFLKPAIDLAKRANDSYLIAFIFALAAALYLRTAESHARVMLETSGQISAGLGAQPRSTGSSSGNAQKPTSKKRKEDNEADVPIGNAPLGLWIGEQFLEMYRLEGNTSKVKKQEEMNARFSTALQRLSERRNVIFPDA